MNIIQLKKEVKKLILIDLLILETAIEKEIKERIIKELKK